MGVEERLAAPRRLLCAAMAWGLITAGVGLAQVAVPRYQSPIEAPRSQPVAIPAPQAATANGTVVEFPIVRVNDQLIDKSDYERSQQQLVEEAQHDNVSAEELAQKQKDLLRDMIDQQLLLSRGKELDIKADSAVIRQLDEIRKKNNLDSMEALERAVRESGISYEDFKAGIKNQTITQEVVGQEVGRRLTLTAKEEQAYYDAHKQEYVQPEQVRLSEILIPTPDNASDAQVAQAQVRADEVETKLKAGGKFEDLAKQYSGGQTAENGGDLGEFKRGQLAKVLEDKTFSLPPGETTAPIRTRQGFVVLKVTEHSAEGYEPLSAVDEQVKNEIYQEAIKPALRTYLTGLREKAYIDIAPGFVDTGASPKETKPVFSAYAVPAVKKKAATKKGRLVQGPAAAGTAVAGTSGAGAVAGAGSAAGDSGAAITGANAAGAGTSAASTSASSTAAVKTVALKRNEKLKKVHREKIRFGQAPRQSLPSGPDESGMTARNLGEDKTAAEALAPGAVIAPIDQTATGGAIATTADVNADPLAPKAPERRKTRFSDRAPVETKAKKVEKQSAKLQAKVAETPAPLTADQAAAQKVQSAPLGLGGDTATKKKKVKVKGAAKERIQQAPPTPAAAKPDATPIPPKSVRQNGEPVVTPAPDPSTLPAVAAPPATP
jgi:peptidyl-prolyl cis-trans isomerase SurA